MGGVLFTDWNIGSIQMHTAIFGGTGGLRPLIFLTFQYAFEQLNVRKVFGLVPEFNARALKLDLHLGFKVEVKIEDVFGSVKDNGLYILSMKKADCRWLDMRCPPIEYAPMMFTDRVDNPLRDMPTVGGVT